MAEPSAAEGVRRRDRVASRGEADLRAELVRQPLAEDPVIRRLARERMLARDRQDPNGAVAAFWSLGELPAAE